MCDPAGKGIDLWQKKPRKTQSFTYWFASYAFFCIHPEDKSFSGITTQCHTPENCYEC